MELAKRAEESGDDVRLVAVIDPRREFGRRGFRHYARRAGELARSGRLLWGVKRKLRHWRSHLMPSRYPELQVVDPLITAMAALRRGYHMRSSGT